MSSPSEKIRIFSFGFCPIRLHHSINSSPPVIGSLESIRNPLQVETHSGACLRKVVVPKVSGSTIRRFPSYVCCQVSKTLYGECNKENPCVNDLNGEKFEKFSVVLPELTNDIADQWAIEGSSIFQGYFHILGGTLSSSNNERKEEANLISIIH